MTHCLSHALPHLLTTTPASSDHLVENVADSSVLIIKSEEDNQPFLVPISLDRIRFMAQTDTHVSISILSQETAELLNITTINSEGYLQLAEKDTKSPRKKVKTPSTLECVSMKISITPDVLPFPEDTFFLVKFGIGVANIPMFFPEERNMETDDCLLCDINQITKLIIDDQDVSFFKELSVVSQNEHPNPSTRCIIPKEVTSNQAKLAFNLLSTIQSHHV